MKKLIISTKSNTYRMIRLPAFIVFLFGLYCSTTYALDPMGPPASNLKHKEIRTGIVFSHSNMDLELYNGDFIEFTNDVLSDWGAATDFSIKDIKTNRVCANISVGLSPNAEAFFRLGGAKTTFDDSIWEDSEEFQSNAELGFGGGLKATFLDEGNIKFGGLIQLNWAKFDGMLDASHWFAPDFVEMNLGEIQIAAGITCFLSKSVSLYGGPFLHFVHGDISDVMSVVDSGTGDLINSKYCWDIREESVFGGYIGTNLELAKNFSLNFEFQHTSSADAFGAGLSGRF